MIKRILRYLSDKINVPDVMQGGYNCGPASLKCVLLHYGVIASERAIAKLAGTNENGTTGEGLVAAADGFGFCGFIRNDCGKRDLQSLLDKNIPPIVDIWFDTEGHYSVVTAMTLFDIQIMDPWHGKKVWMPYSEFEKIWFDFECGDFEHKRPINKRIIIIKKKL